MPWHTPSSDATPSTWAGIGTAPIAPLRRHGVIILTIIILTALCYAQVAWHEFIDFDSKWFLERTPIRHGLTAANFLWAFGLDTPGGWSPLTWLSHMALVNLFDMQAGPHHIANVVLHACNAVLLYVLIERMTGRRGPAAMVAILFAMHPLHVEVVAWPAERSMVLAQFFILLTLLAYGRYCRRPGFSSYGLVLSLFALGLLAKPMTMTLPFAMILLDYWPLRRTAWLRVSDGRRDPVPFARLVLEKTPMIAMAVVSGVLTIIVQRNVQGLTSLQKMSLPDRLCNSLVAYVGYLDKLFWPSKLAIFYPYESALPWWRVTLAAALLVVVTWIALRQRRKMPWLAVGWLWYLGTFVTMIGLVHTGAQAMADRYAYLPAVGIDVMVVFSAASLAERWRPATRFIAGASVGICLLLAIACTNQVRYWRNAVTLFTHALEVTRDNYLAHNNLGAALLARGAPGDVPSAQDHFTRAIQIKSDYLNAKINLARSLTALGHADQAIAAYERTIEQHPTSALAMADLGVALANKGDHAAAIQRYRQALSIDGGAAPVYYNLAMSLLAVGDRAQAADQFEAAVQLDASAPHVWMQLGGLRHQQGDLAGAAACYQRVLALAPMDVPARYRLGQAMLAMGNAFEAETQFRRVTELDAAHAGAHHFLGLTQVAQGRPESAIESYGRALAIRPLWPQARNDMGVALAQLGRLDAAVQQFTLAVEQDPAFADARHNLDRAKQKVAESGR